MLEFFAKSEQEQEQVGAALSALLTEGLIIYLQGDLGTGKTTLVRGLLRALGHVGAVKSPTYTLIEPYEVGETRISHFDLYRLSDPEELEYLGIRDMLADRSIMLFEWPEKGTGVIPADDLEICIEYHIDGRALNFMGHTEQGKALIVELKSKLQR